MRLASLFDRVTLVGIGIILFQNSVAAGGIPGSGIDQPVDQEVKTSGDILEDASSLKRELASLRDELAALKAQEESSDNERSKRLDSLAEENRELVQLVHTIASAGNGSYGGTAGDADVSQSSTEGSPKVELHMTATGGANYIRWGRTTCAGGATVLYTGFAASGGSSNSGGTSDIICLHSNPEVGDTVAGGTLYSPLTILEYQFNSAPFKTTNNRGQPLINNDVPCVVCHVRTRTNQLMIPGRYTCPSGWTSEYWGYLVSTRYNNVKGSIICVDEGPESVSGGSLAASALLSVYPVEVKCAGSHCPPYRADNEVTCAVCSK